MLITIAAIIATIVVTTGLSFGRFARSEGWAATVTPLASIIGSGFLISGPLLAREFGGAAFWAMAVLLLLAYAVGAVIRWNIVHVENYLADKPFNDPVLWSARITQFVLAGAYAVSVAYYLKLLAEFAMKSLAVPEAWHGIVSNIGVTAIIIVGSLPFIVFGLIWMINASYMQNFFVDQRLMVAGGGGLIWMGIGAFIMSRMVNFEI